MKSLPPFALEVRFSRWEFRARYNVAGSDMESMPLNELLALASPERRDQWERLWLGYTETWGAPFLRRAVAQTYPGLDDGHVLCFAGAEEGIFCAMHALLEPGDHALICCPNYQSAEVLPASLCEVSGITLDPEDGWNFDPDAVRRAMRPNTKLVSINFPNNPTGAVLERERFEALVTLCRERGVWLFSDEVYHGMERDPGMTLPPAASAYEKGVSLGVMSKAYGLAGLRIGWIACRDTEVLQRMERFKHYLSICNSAPSELLACIALEAREQLLHRNRTLAAANRALLRGFFSRHADRFAWYEPDAGCIAFPRYLGAQGVDAFADRLVEESGVLLMPASVFQSSLGDVQRDRFRVGYGRSFFPEALDVWERWLENNP